MTTSLLDRVLSKIAIIDECWVWKASLKPSGYGQLRVDGKTLYAHRVMYELLVGPIREDLQIDHLCRNRACVNPDHLELVTAAVNVRRGISPAADRARQTHCKRGHEFTVENTYYRKTGWRSCRICNNGYARTR